MIEQIPWELSHVKLLFSVANIYNLFDFILRVIIAIYLITVLLPLSNLFGFYDHILAFSYFSGKPKYGRIHFNNKFETEQLPSYIKNIVREYNGDYYIDLNEWSAYTIKVMVYPETRVYHKLKAYIDEHLEDPNTHLEFY